MDAADLRLFTDSVRQAAQQQSGAELDASFDELGWRDALLDDPTAATAAVFAVQGEAGASSSALDDVVVAALGLEPAGELGVVLPGLGNHVPPGTVDGARLTVRGAGTRRLRSANEAIVVATRGDEQLVVRVPVGGLQLRLVEGMDPDGGWVEVSGDLELTAVQESKPWAAAVIAGQLAIAQELTSSSRQTLKLARDHAAERIQFGRPIGSFQAVRHRLADCLIAVESADAATSVGWAEPSTLTAAMAKAIAGRSSRTVARHAQQVLAGMGFTSEHPFHGYLKRALVLDQLFGSSAALSEAIGNEVLTTRALPEMLAL